MLDGQNLFGEQAFAVIDGLHALTRLTTPTPAGGQALDLQAEVEAIARVVPRTLAPHASWAVPLLLSTARSGGITHPRRVAYVLAVAQHGSHFGARLVEPGTGPVVDGVDHSFNRYEPGTALGTALGNTRPGDGEMFRGRGFVRIRGRAAYAAWSKRLGLPEEFIDGVPVPCLVAHPGMLAQPNIAAQTAVRGMRDGIFTGLALGSFVNDKKADYHNAHRVIDGARHAREIAATAAAFAAALERLHNARHEARIHHLPTGRSGATSPRNLLQDVREAVERLTIRGEAMAEPREVIEWNGEARQGKFVQLDQHTCALHLGRGIYVRLDVQRDLNGIVPPEARTMALKRSGDVRPAVRPGDANFWR